MRSGRIVDMSSSGLRIESSHTAIPGQPLEVEIEPEDSGEVMLLRGRVVHAAPTAAGRFNIGVHARFDVKGSLSERTKIDVASENALAAGSDVPDIAALPSQPRRKPRARTALVLLLLALLGLLSLPSDYPRIAAIGNGAVFQGNADDVQRLEPPLPSLLLTANRAAVRPSQEFVPVPAEPIAKRPDSDAEAIRMPADQLPERVEQAEKLAGEGGRLGAQTLLEGVIADSDALHPVWRERAQAQLAALVDEAPATVEPLDAEVELAQAEPAAEDAPVLLEVNAATFVLHVRRHGAIVRSFPVGLGRDGATPLGRFRIADKIRDPDWYDRGRMVPAGSPENPLGASWMGLATGGAANGIGIHPAPDNASVEQPVSRGCIRMTPADAEALFRLVPQGTPVWIHE